MSPTLKTFFVTLCSFALLNCGGSESSPSSTATLHAGTTAVTMQLEFPETPLVDSLVVDCRGADTLHYSVDPGKPYLELDLFPYESWKFSAKLYANGHLMQQGEATAKLEAGTPIDITIKMHALSGFVHVEIPLGLGNPAGIASGLMRIAGPDSTVTYPMQVSGSTAVFTSAMLPLGVEYTLTLTMQDSSGADIYSATETFTLSETAPVPALQIKSLRSQVGLAIELAADCGGYYDKPKGREMFYDALFCNAEPRMGNIPRAWKADVTAELRELSRGEVRNTRRGLHR
jgi:hypothetical protein